MLDPINSRARKSTVSDSVSAEKFNNLPLLPGKDVGKYKRSSNISHPDKRMFSNRILDAAGNCDFERRLPHFESVSLAAGRELYAAGEINDYVYFPETAVGAAKSG